MTTDIGFDVGASPTSEDALRPGEDPAARGVEASPASASRGDGPTRREFVAGVAAAAAMACGSPLALAAGQAPGPVYRIHPGIGIARAGSADPSTFFIGPEIPGQAPLGGAPGTAVPPYKAGNKIKPQAARFRIFEYQWISGRLTPVREVTLDTPGVAGIKWAAHLANRKASFHRFAGPAGESTPPAAYRNAAEPDRRSLEIDFGPRVIAGRSQGPKEFRAGTSADPTQESFPVGPGGAPVIDYLGQLRTDAQGRLIVIGGRGKAAYRTAVAPPIASYANNDDWFDDVSDGPITASVVLADGNGGTREVPVDTRGSAWVLVGPPDYSPGIRAVVSLYDLLFDMGVRKLPIPADSALYDSGMLARLRSLKADYRATGAVEFPTYRPDFALEIRPILENSYNLWYITHLVTDKHNGLISPTLGDPDPQFARSRQKVFEFMRAPEGAAAGTGSRSMPKQLGDNPYDGHAPEYVRRLPLTRTQFGLLRRWAGGDFTPGSAPAPAISPHGLEQAALEAASGGAFYPGIEVGWQIRNPALFSEPFRIDPTATSVYFGEEGTPIRAGHFSRQMALPWHGDFNACAAEGGFGWWPSSRPDDALPQVDAPKRLPWARADDRFEAGNRESTKEDMVAHWDKFGIVVEKEGIFVETERAPKIP